MRIRRLWRRIVGPFRRRQPVRNPFPTPRNIGEYLANKDHDGTTLSSELFTDLVRRVADLDVEVRALRAYVVATKRTQR